MAYNENFATLVRQGVLIRVARAMFDGILVETVDRLPFEMRPRRAQSLTCCTYHDRAVLRYRVLAALGFAAGETDDDATPLADYARRALARERPEGPTLSVIDAACSACVQSRYEITSTCRGCMARPCLANCPKHAISMVGRQARIDAEQCVSCGRCQQVCPFHAIVRIPIPCEEACPVDAINKDASGREIIDPDQCIACGKCAMACPFGAVAEKSQLVDVLRHLRAGTPVVALPAPAVYGQFPGGFARLAAALRRLGFARVAEVAEGADLTALAETQEFAERVAQGAALMTTSCCPAYVSAVERHVPALRPCVSHTPSPMRLLAQAVKRDTPAALTVFIGPCTAKRQEALTHPECDYVLTFEELDAIFVASDIAVELEPAADETAAASGAARGFAASGGVTAAVKAIAPAGLDFRPVLIDGLSAKNMRLLKAYASKCPGNFLEVMSCEGGCVAGPRTVVSPQEGATALKAAIAACPRAASKD